MKLRLFGSITALVISLTAIGINFDTQWKLDEVERLRAERMAPPAVTSVPLQFRTYTQRRPIYQVLPPKGRRFIIMPQGGTYCTLRDRGTKVICYRPDGEA